MARSHQRHDRQKQSDGKRTQQDICLRECPASTDRSGWPDHMDMIHGLSPSKWSAPPSSDRREPPHDPAGCRLAALVVVERFTPLPEKTMHVSCQSKRFVLKKTKNLVSRPETLFLLRAASFLATLEARGGGAIRSGGVERIAPGGWGKSLHPPREVFLCKNEPERGFTLDRRGQR